VPSLPGEDLTGPRRVGLYTRVSTTEQDASNQLDRLKDWAIKNNLEVAAKETDRASGKLTVRRGQERLMAEARGHHLHAIAVAKVDRWARSIQHLSTSINELHELGVDFYAVDQGLTVRRADPTSKLILNVLGAVAEWEAEHGALTDAELEAARRRVAEERFHLFRAMPDHHNRLLGGCLVYRLE